MEYPLEVLRDENKVYGFAIWHTLTALVDYASAGIGDQPAAKDADPARPQTVTMTFDFERPALMPPDFYEYDLKVVIDPSVPFMIQEAVLTACSCEEGLVEGDVEVAVSSYSLRLTELLQLLPRLKGYGSQILPCLEVVDSNNYCVSVD